VNERIKELELQAYVEVTQPWRDPSSGYVYEITGKEFSREKFAELIVRECANYITDKATIETLLGERLMEHFGVEE
jgi:hypothetical protein